MFARSMLSLAMAVLVTGLATAPALAADSRNSASEADKMKATRLQVELNCQSEGDRSYGTYGFGSYGCTKDNGAWIDCKADGQCQAGEFSPTAVSRDGKS